MDIKNTIEILTKDIQDIEKLVGRLQNSPEASAIELDLALSKLRNVYEVLTMIKADRMQAMASRGNAPDPAPEVKREPSPEASEKPAPQPEPAKEAAPEPEPPKKPAKAPAGEPSPDPGILAEKFSAESSINENLASQRAPDMDSKLTGQPIDNIGRNIGINDRFLIIRELFEGDADGFRSLVDNLDSAGNYSDAMNLIEERFTGSMEHEGVEILVGLARRRFNAG